MSSGTLASAKPIVQSVIAKCDGVATLPEITVRIIGIVEDADSTARDLYDVIKTDPALAARILKVVNSAFYGLPGQVGEVDRAIVLLGMPAVKNIAVATTVGTMFCGRGPDGLFEARDLWVHSLAVALAAKKITEAAGRYANADEMFLAGLIHDLGLMLECQVMPEQLGDVIREVEGGATSFTSVEESIIGATHEDLGEALAWKWKFPTSLRIIIGAHHRPDIVGEEYRWAAAALSCADILCCNERLGFSMTGDRQEFTEELLETIGVSVGQLSLIRDGLEDELAVAERVLSLRD